MASDRPFGIDPEEFERALREAGIELRDLLGRAGEYIDRTSGTTLSSLFGQFAQPERSRPPEPADEPPAQTGSGVWVIYSIDDTDEARVEQVFPNELEALRAHRDNTDERRRVRFLPFGVPVTALGTP